VTESKPSPSSEGWARRRVDGRHRELPERAVSASLDDEESRQGDDQHARADSGRDPGTDTAEQIGHHDRGSERTDAESHKYRHHRQQWGHTWGDLDARPRRYARPHTPMDGPPSESRANRPSPTACSARPSLYRGSSSQDRRRGRPPARRRERRQELIRLPVTWARARGRAGPRRCRSPGAGATRRSLGRASTRPSEGAVPRSLR
jgi:hypothetical protein